MSVSKSLTPSVDRVYPSYRMQVRRRRESRSFEQLVAELTESDTAERVRALSFGAEFTSDTYLARSEYARLLGNFVERFGFDRLHVCFSEQLREAPHEFLGQLLNFLGVDGIARWLWRATPQGFRRQFLYKYRTEINVKKAVPKPMSELQRSELRRFFRNDVLMLEKLVAKRPPWPEFFESDVERGGAA